MQAEYLEQYSQKLNELTEKERKLRNIYLRKLEIGEIQGPRLESRSINKSWLKFYDEAGLDIEYPKMTMYQYMMNKNRDHMDDVALRYFGRKITYKEFDENIDKTVRSLKKMGVKKGDKVTICMPNTPEGVYAVYACRKMGAVAAMIHPKSAENEIKNFVNEIDSKVVIILDRFAKNLETVINDTKVEHAVVVSPTDSMTIKGIAKVISRSIKSKIRAKFKKDDGKNKKPVKKEEKTEKFKTDDKRFTKWNEFIDLTKNDNSKVEEQPYEKDALAVILRTGGSTGTPKGVELTDDNFNTMVEQFFQNESNFKRGDKLLAMMPIFHGFGLCSSVHLPLSVGVNVNLVPELKGEDMLLEVLKEENHIIGVPTFLDAILKSKLVGKIKDLSHLKYIVSGGDSDTDKTEADFNKFLEERNCKAKLCKGYGLAEMVAGATFACGEYNKIGSIGIPMVDTDFKLVKPGTNEEINEDDVVGEMCLKGPSVMKGYYGNEEETNECLKNGWLHTGDLAVWKDGLLYFKQRKGDMIINSGINVYPREIERVLIEHEAIESVTVIGLYHPYKKQVPKAYIKLKEGYVASNDLINEFKELCKKNLNIYSNPYDYEFVNEVPQTLLGKVNRKALKEKEQTKILTLQSK